MGAHTMIHEAWTALLQVTSPATRKIYLGSIESTLSCLLKDKIPQYHGVLPYSDFYIRIYQYFTEKFTKFVHF